MIAMTGTAFTCESEDLSSSCGGATTMSGLAAEEVAVAAVLIDGCGRIGT